MIRPTITKGERKACIDSLERNWPDPDSEAPTTPQSHWGVFDDETLEASYGEPNKYPGHPDYKGEVIRTDDQMEPRGYKPGSYRDLQGKNTYLKHRVAALEDALSQERGAHETTKKVLDAWRNAGQEAANERDEARKERDEAIRRAERAEGLLEREPEQESFYYPWKLSYYRDVKGDKPINCGTTKESVDAISDDIKTTDWATRIDCVTANEAVRAGDFLDDYSGCRRIVRVGAPTKSGLINIESRLLQDREDTSGVHWVFGCGEVIRGE